MTGNAGSSAAGQFGNSIIGGTQNAAQSQLAAANAIAAGQSGSANTINSSLSSALNNGLYGYFANTGGNSVLNNFGTSNFVPGPDPNILSF